MQKEINNNPLLNNWILPPFDKIKSEDFLPAIQFAVSRAKQEIDAIVANPEEPTFENTIVALDKNGMLYSDICNIFYNLLEAESNEELQEIAEKLIPIEVEFSNYIFLNDALFQKIKHVYQKRDSLNLAEDALTLLTDNYKSFCRNGANLNANDRKRYEKLVEELSKKSLQFKNNLLSATTAFEMYFPENEKDQLKGLPENELALAHAKALEKSHDNGWSFDLSMPSYSAFIKYVENRDLRKKIYFAYNSRAFGGNFDNSQTIFDILHLRKELAQLLGYQTYSDYVLEERMVKSSKEVFDFLHQLINIFKPVSQEEVKMLTEFAHENHFEGELQAWDWSFYANKYQLAHFQYDEQEVKPYFQLENVQKGIFSLAEQLYGIHIKENSKIPVYQNDVKAYEIFENEEKIGTLYMDFFPRNSKRNGAWMTSFKDQGFDADGNKILPIVSLVFNFTPATADMPSLLTFNEVSTFLHEFGHGLHGLLSKVRYNSLSGTSVVRDFVELPSQIMEHWATETEFLQTFAFHYQNHEPIKADLIEKIKLHDNFLSGYYNMRQFTFGLLDMQMHSQKTDWEGNLEAIEEKITQITQVLPHVKGTCISTAFSHLFGGGYASGYYGYKWAEMLADDAFAEFSDKGIFSKETAKRFRENILSQGGNVDAMELYIRFKGKKPTIDALLKRYLGEKYYLCNFVK